MAPDAQVLLEGIFASVLFEMLLVSPVKKGNEMEVWADVGAELLRQADVPGKTLARVSQQARLATKLNDLDRPFIARSYPPTPLPALPVHTSQRPSGHRIYEIQSYF